MLAEKQEERSGRITVGADKTHDAKDFVVAALALNVTPNITKNENGRSSNIDGETIRRPGYCISPELSLAGREGRPATQAIDCIFNHWL